MPSGQCSQLFSLANVQSIPAARRLKRQFPTREEAAGFIYSFWNWGETCSISFALLSLSLSLSLSLLVPIAFALLCLPQARLGLIMQSALLDWIAPDNHMHLGSFPTTRRSSSSTGSSLHRPAAGASEPATPPIFNPPPPSLSISLQFNRQYFPIFAYCHSSNID